MCATSSERHPVVRGFTLIELLVVLSVVALMSLAIPWSLDRWIPARRMASTTATVGAALREARLRALRTQSMVEVQLDRDGEHPSLIVVETGSSGDPIPLPAQQDLNWIDADARARSDSMLSIRFAPDGSSSGARWHVTDRTRQMSITVSALTGRVSVDRL